MSDPSRPEKNPLSADDADRLSERYTASWDAEEGESAAAPPRESPLPSPLAAPAALAPVGVAATLPADHRPLTPQRSVHIGKQTLLGLPNPLLQAEPPPRSAVAAAPAANEPTPFGPPVAFSPLRETAPFGSPSPLGSTPPMGSPTTAALASETPGSKPPPSERSSPSAAVHGLTAPAKRYVPKDDPSTPAVVIADVTQTRSAPTITAGLRSVGEHEASATTGKASRDFVIGADELLLRRRSVPLSLILGGLGLVVAALVIFGLRSASAPAPSTLPEMSAARAATPKVEPALEPPPPPPPAAEPSAIPVATPEAAAEPAAAAPVAPAEHVTRPAAEVSKNTKRAATPAKSRAEVRTPATVQQAEPGPAFAPRGKSVIVRETPF